MATARKTANDAYDAAAFQPEAFKEGYEKFADRMSQVADFNKTSLEAMMAFAGAMTKGVERLSAEQTDFVKSSYENAVSSMKAASSAKSVQEAMDIQSELARETMEANLSQVSKVAEMVMDTTKDAVAPLTERYSELVEKIQSFRP